MHAATTMEPSSPPPVFHSAMSLAPGRPRPLARRLAIHNQVMRSIRRFMDDQLFNEIPISYPTSSDNGCIPTSRQTGYLLLQGMVNQGFPAIWCEGEQNSFETNNPDTNYLLTGFKLIQASMINTSANELADLMENLVKTIVAGLGADLLGGRHIIRLNRMLELKHPHLSYDRALEIVNQRGFDLKHGQTIPPEALATLTRYVHNMPFILTDHPETGDGFVYVFPFAGQLGHAITNTTAGNRNISFTLEVAPLLQYVMGLGSVNDAAIHPLGPLTYQTLKIQQGRA